MKSKRLLILYGAVMALIVAAGGYVFAQRGESIGEPAEKGESAHEQGEPADEQGVRPATVLNQWKGRRALGSEPIAIAFVTDEETLEKVWKDWGVDAPLPSIDFDEEIVLTLIVRSGMVMFIDPVIRDGDLRRNGVATPDFPSYWSYVIAVVKRDGIRSVDGQEL